MAAWKTSWCYASSKNQVPFIQQATVQQFATTYASKYYNTELIISYFVIMLLCKQIALKMHRNIFSTGLLLTFYHMFACLNPKYFCLTCVIVFSCVKFKGDVVHQVFRNLPHLYFRPCTKKRYTLEQSVAVVMKWNHLIISSASTTLHQISRNIKTKTALLHLTSLKQLTLIIHITFKITSIL